MASNLLAMLVMSSMLFSLSQFLVVQQLRNKRPAPSIDVLPLHTLVINLDLRKDRWEGKDTFQFEVRHACIVQREHRNEKQV